MLLFLRLAPLTSGLIGEDAEGSPETSPIAQDLHLTLAEGDWWRTSFVSESWSSPLQLSVKVLSSTGCSEGATTDGTCVFGLKLYGSQHGPSASTVRCHAAGRLLARGCFPLLPAWPRALATGEQPRCGLRSGPKPPLSLPGAHDPGPRPRATSRATRARTTRARTADSNPSPSPSPSPKPNPNPDPGPDPDPDPDPDPSPSPSPNQARRIVCSCPLARSSG